MQNKMKFYREEAENALKKIFQPGDVFEIRILDAQTTSFNRPHTVSGYFDYEHIETVVNLIERDIRFARGIYYTPNPVENALLARACNRFRDMGQRDPSTADKDIPRRRWLLIDCDAVRPSGISSSKKEHDAALAKAAEIRDGLKSMGYPDPVEIDSGNGAQLMFRIDLTGGTDDAICKGILQALQSVNSDAVEIDKTVFNSSRIWRLPGSVNCKGDPIPDRPHRTAKILKFPESLETVPKELLKQTAGISDPEPYNPEDYTTSANTGAKLANINFSKVDTHAESFNLESWIEKYAPDAEGPQQWQDGRKWVFPICPFNSEHRNKSAIITEQSTGAIGFTCHHNSCTGNNWQKLRELREPGYKERNTTCEKITGGIKFEEQQKETVKIQPEPVITEQESPEEEITEDPAPWRDVTTDDVQAVLSGTYLGEMTNLYASVTIPPLPVEAALLKAIVTAGCAFSEEKPKDTTKFYLIQPRGAQNARLKINTAGGQVCNVYALLCANSASGKDIGSLLDMVTAGKGWYLGTSGSAEGLAEALKKIPNGLISISEFENWLDERHWQHKATSFLTEAFGKGFFQHNFSSRSGKQGESKTDYCYPNIIANIQPEVFENVVRKQDISSGFLGRFLYARMPEFFGDPANIDMPEILSSFSDILTVFQKKHGTVEVPEGYGKALSEMFKLYSPQKLHPVWRRLVNEYMPRLACMLSINHTARSRGDNILLESAHWAGAETLVKWFFGNAEKLLMPIEDESREAREFEKNLRKIVNLIAKLDHGSGITKQQVSRYLSHGTSSSQRVMFLQELIDRDWIYSTVENRVTHGAKFRIKNLPPGVLID